VLIRQDDSHLRVMASDWRFYPMQPRKILDFGIKNPGLEGVFKYVLNRGYPMVIGAFNLKREEIFFVPFTG